MFIMNLLTVTPQLSQQEKIDENNNREAKNCTSFNNSMQLYDHLQEYSVFLFSYIFCLAFFLTIVLLAILWMVFFFSSNTDKSKENEKYYAKLQNRAEMLMASLILFSFLFVVSVILHLGLISKYKCANLYSVPFWSYVVAIFLCLLIFASIIFLMNVREIKCKVNMTKRAIAAQGGYYATNDGVENIGNYSHDISKTFAFIKDSKIKKRHRSYLSFLNIYPHEHDQ